MLMMIITVLIMSYWRDQDANRDIINEWILEIQVRMGCDFV